jgi:hypothetical protein
MFLLILNCLNCQMIQLHRFAQRIQSFLMFLLIQKNRKYLCYQKNLMFQKILVDQFYLQLQKRYTER